MKRRALLAALLLPMFPAAALPGAAAEWQVVNDGVMGGVSSAQVAASADGALRFSGVVRLDYNGGFASARRAATLPADATGLAITARGDGNRYRLTLFTRDARTGARQPFMYYAVFDAGIRTQRSPTDDSCRVGAPTPPPQPSPAGGGGSKPLPCNGGAAVTARAELRFADFRASFRGRAVPDAPPLAAVDVIGIGLMITKAEHAAGSGAFAMELVGVEPLR